MKSKMDARELETVEGKAYVYTGQYNVYGKGLLPWSILQNLVEQHVWRCNNRLLINQTANSAGALKSVQSHLDIQYNQTKEHLYEKYKFGLLLGYGSYGIIYKARHPRLGNVAIKQYEMLEMHDTSECFKERDLLVFLKHERVVPIIGAFYYERTPFIVMEQCRRSLSKIKYLPAFEIVRYTQQLLEGLQFIHGKRIIHCNIKMSNLLINKHNNLVLSDFGEAICLKEDMDSFYSDRFVGKAGYSDYDVLNNFIYTPGNDVFSAGCVLFEISTKKPLMFYLGIMDRDFYKDIIKRGYKLDLDKKKLSLYNTYKRQSLSERAAESFLGKLINLMIKQNTPDRPSAEDLLNSDELKDLKQQYKVGHDVNKSNQEIVREFSGKDILRHRINHKTEKNIEDTRLLNLVFSTYYYDSEEKELFDITSMASNKVFTKKPVWEKWLAGGESSAESVGESRCEQKAEPSKIPEKKIFKSEKASSDESDSDTHSDSSNEPKATTAVAVAVVSSKLPPAQISSEVNVEKFIYDLFRQQPEVAKLYHNLQNNDVAWLESVNNIRTMLLPKKPEKRCYEPMKSMEELNNIVFEWDLRMQQWAKMSGNEKKKMSHKMKGDSRILNQQVKPPVASSTSHDEGNDRVENSNLKDNVRDRNLSKMKLVKTSNDKPNQSTSKGKPSKSHESPGKINAEVVDISKIKRKRAIRDSSSLDSDEGLQKPEDSTKRRKKVDPVKPKEIIKKSLKSSSSRTISSKALETKPEASTKVVTKCSTSNKGRCKYCKLEFLDMEECRMHVKVCVKKR